MQNLKTSLITILFIFLAFFLYTRLSGPIPFSVNSIQTTKSTLFSVSGTGEITTIPNIAYITVGVTKTASTVTDAQNQINQISKKIVADLRGMGIEEKYIKTINYSINPNYDYRSSRQTITGYTATQDLQIKVTPIDKVNQAIDMATTNGANVAGGITFDIDDKTKKDSENKAREAAVKDAKEKAQGLANASGIKLGKIVNVEENANYAPRPIMFNKALSSAGSGIPEAAMDQTSITPGQNTITSTITISYETF